MTSAAVLVESRARQDDIGQARMAHEPPSPLLSRSDPSQLCRLVQMASKDRRLAGNSKLVAAGGATSLGNPYRRVRVAKRRLRS